MGGYGLKSEAVWNKNLAAVECVGDSNEVARKKKSLRKSGNGSSK